MMFGYMYILCNGIQTAINVLPEAVTPSLIILDVGNPGSSWQPVRDRKDVDFHLYLLNCVYCISADSQIETSVSK